MSACEVQRAFVEVDSRGLIDFRDLGQACMYLCSLSHLLKMFLFFFTSSFFFFFGHMVSLSYLPFLRYSTYHVNQGSTCFSLPD